MGSWMYFDCMIVSAIISYPIPRFYVPAKKSPWAYNFTPFYNFDNRPSITFRSISQHQLHTLNSIEMIYILVYVIGICR